MISLDAGDLLPPELASIFATLRNQAYRMPPAQLNAVLAAEWGADWRRRFRRFDASPIAAASIGQVHRATLPDGRVLAIKVQYPGVRASIESDVDNVATLLRVSNLLPASLDLKPLLAEAKRQLAEEADYRREGAQMRDYGARLAGDPRYIVPAFDDGLTTSNILAMAFVEGRPIEALSEASQAVRDQAMTALIDLVLRELFEFGVMQTDPNFANYRWQPDTGALVPARFRRDQGDPAGHVGLLSRAAGGRPRARPRADQGHRGRHRVPRRGGGARAWPGGRPDHRRDRRGDGEAGSVRLRRPGVCPRHPRRNPRADRGSRDMARARRRNAVRAAQGERDRAARRAAGRPGGRDRTGGVDRRSVPLVAPVNLAAGDGGVAETEGIKPDS